MLVLAVRLVSQGIKPLLPPLGTLLDQNDGHRRECHNDATEERECPSFAYGAYYRIDHGSGSGCKKASSEVELCGTQQ